MFTNLERGEIMKVKKIIPALLLALTLGACAPVGGPSFPDSSIESSESQSSSQESSSVETSDPTSEESSEEESSEDISSEEPSSETPSSEEQSSEEPSSEEPSSEESSSETPSVEDPSSEESSEPSSSEDSSSEEPGPSDPAIPGNVTSKIGSRQAFYEALQEWSEGTITSAKTEVLDKTAYKHQRTTSDITIHNNELLVEIETEDFNDGTTVESLEYASYFDMFGYHEIKGNRSQRFRIVDAAHKDENVPDTLTLEEAKEKFEDEVESYTLESLGYKLSAHSYFGGTMVQDKEWSVKFNESGNGYVVTSTGYMDATTETVYIGEFHVTAKLELVSIYLTINKYANNTFDFNKFDVIGDAQPTSVKIVKLEDVTFGTLSTVSQPSISLIPYFVTEITGFPAVTTTTYSNTGEMFTSEPWTIYEGCPVDLPLEQLKEDKTFTPETALDIDSLYITSNSNEKALYYDGWGYVAGEVDEYTLVTVGNSSIPNMFEIGLKVVEDPTKAPATGGNTPLFMGATILAHDWENDKVSQDMMGETTIDIKVVDGINEKYFGIYTANEGPFDLTGYSMIGIDGLHKYELISEGAEYEALVAAFDGMTNLVFFKITATQDGQELAGIMDPNYEALVTFNVNVTGISGGSSEGNTPKFMGAAITPLDWENDKVSYSDEGDTVVNLVMNNENNTKYFGIYTANEGPFNLDGYSLFGTSDLHGYELIGSGDEYEKLVAAFDGMTNYVFVKVAAKTNGQEFAVLFDSEYNEVLAFEVSVTGFSSGSGEGTSDAGELIEQAIFDTLALTNVTAFVNGEMYDEEGNLLESLTAKVETDGTAIKINSEGREQQMPGEWPISMVISDFNYAGEIYFEGLKEVGGAYAADYMVIKCSGEKLIERLISEGADIDPSKCVFTNDGFEVEFENVWVELDGEYLSTLAYRVIEGTSWQGRDNDDGNYEYTFTTYNDGIIDYTINFSNIGTTSLGGSETEDIPTTGVAGSLAGKTFEFTEVQNPEDIPEGFEESVTGSLGATISFDDKGEFTIDMNGVQAYGIYIQDGNTATYIQKGAIDDGANYELPAELWNELNIEIVDEKTIVVESLVGGGDTGPSVIRLVATLVE